VGAAVVANEFNFVSLGTGIEGSRRLNAHANKDRSNNFRITTDSTLCHVCDGDSSSDVSTGTGTIIVENLAAYNRFLFCNALINNSIILSKKLWSLNLMK
jgi:hypothetical protein